MATKKWRSLVIDASIANAAGELNPASQHHRDFLETARKVGHRVVLTPEIKAEWDKHQTRYALKWLRSMVASKQVCWLEAVVREDLRDNIAKVATHELAYRASMISLKSLYQLDPHSIHAKSCAAMLKDTHLLEAALATDRTVISVDDIVRKLFAVAGERIREIKNIVWVHLDGSDPKVLTWLEGGAKSEKKR